MAVIAAVTPRFLIAAFILPAACSKPAAAPSKVGANNLRIGNTSAAKLADAIFYVKKILIFFFIKNIKIH